MIEINCNDWYKALKMLNGVVDEYRFHIDESGMHAVSVDNSNVIMQSIHFNKSSMLTMCMVDEEPTDIGLCVSQLLPFAKSHKSDGYMKLIFERNPEGKNIHSGKIVTDKGAVLEFKTLDVSLIRRDPIVPRYPFKDEYSQFVVTAKELKQSFKDIGCSKKNNRVIFKFNGDSQLCIEGIDGLQSVIPHVKNTQWCMFSYDLIKIIADCSDPKDNLQFTITKDYPAAVTNMSVNFDNVFLCAPRIQAD